MSRKTDSGKPADWIEIAEADIIMVRLVAEREVSFGPCRSKLAEALEKVLKAELIRLGWPLEKTHDLQRLGKLLPRFRRGRSRMASFASTTRRGRRIG